MTRYLYLLGLIVGLSVSTVLATSGVVDDYCATVSVVSTDECRVLEVMLPLTANESGSYDITRCEIESVSCQSGSVTMLDLGLMQSGSGFSLSGVDLGVFSGLDQLIVSDFERDLGVLGEVDLPALTFLDLSNNALGSVGFLDQWSLPKLETLDLSANQLDHINIDVSQLPSLYTLDLSNNRFDSLLHIQPFASQIEYLHMADNEIFAIDNNLPEFTYLLHLGLQHNKISSIAGLTPERFPSLRYLFAADNQIQSLAPLWSNEWGFYFIQVQNNGYSGYISLDALDTDLGKLGLYLWQGNNLCGKIDEFVFSGIDLYHDATLQPREIPLCEKEMICGGHDYCASGLECRGGVCLPPLPAMGAVETVVNEQAETSIPAEPTPLPVVVPEQRPVVVNRSPSVPSKSIYRRPTLLPESTPVENTVAPLDQDGVLGSGDAHQMAARSENEGLAVLPSREELTLLGESTLTVFSGVDEVVEDVTVPGSTIIKSVIDDNGLTPVRDTYRKRIKSMSPGSRSEILFGTDVVEEAVVTPTPPVQITSTLWSGGDSLWWSPSYAWTTGILNPLRINDALLLLSVWHESGFPTESGYITGRQFSVTQGSCVRYSSMDDFFGLYSDDIYRCLGGMRRFLLSIDFYDFSHLVKQFSLLKT